MRRLDAGPVLDDALAPYVDADRPPPVNRPWVLANMVCGLDGSTAVDGRVGPLSDPTDRQLFVDLRSVADIVLVGAETARRERYGPVRLSPTRRARREAEGRPPVPRLAVVSRSLDLDGIPGLTASGDGGQRPMVLTCESSPPDRRELLGDTADVILAGTTGVDPKTALAGLRRAGVGIVLCEGGPRLLGELLAVGQVDELCLTLSPLVGGDPLPVAVLPTATSTSTAALAHVLEADGTLFLRYLFP